MSDFVLDASVALAWVLDRPEPIYALQVRKELARGKRGLVPALWFLEVANGLAMAERRGDLTSVEVDIALKQIESTAASSLNTDTGLTALRDALTGARTWQLTAYDASYLDLARREGLPLATLDKSLASAAKKAGVAIL